MLHIVRRTISYARHSCEGTKVNRIRHHTHFNLTRIVCIIIVRPKLHIQIIYLANILWQHQNIIIGRTIILKIDTLAACMGYICRIRITTAVTEAEVTVINTSRHTYTRCIFKAIRVRQIGQCNHITLGTKCQVVRTASIKTVCHRRHNDIIYRTQRQSR